MPYIIFIVTFLLYLPLSLFSQIKYPDNIIKGEVMFSIYQEMFDFPLEVYGAYIHVHDRQVTIDSVVYLTFRDEYRNIKNEQVIAYDVFKDQYPDIAQKIHLNLSKPLVNFFERYGVYFIKRSYKTFSPIDTLKRISRRELFNRRFKYLFPELYNDTTDYSLKVFGPEDKILTTENANKYLLVKFNPDFDVQEVMKNLKQLDCVKSVNPNVRVEFFSTAQNIPPNDPEYYQQYYFHESMMDFEGAWQTIIGENGNPLITIAIIDGNFAFADSHWDLDVNFNPNGPAYDSNEYGDGHGTKVASVAGAITDDGVLIAGASYNCLFMPFSAYSSDEVNNALRKIKEFLNDSNPENDCLVVNISLGYDLENSQVTAIINDLYVNYNLLFVAAVADWGTDDTVYPAMDNNVIGVGASDANDAGLAYLSNWGNDVELLATGEQILTVDPFDDYNWGWEWGTSFAAPIVSGLCALARSHPTGYTKSNDVIRQDLRNGAKLFYEHDRTYYRINAKAAIDEVTPVRDEIVINGPKILSPLENYTFYANFYDYSPTGNYIVGNWNWVLKAKLTNGYEQWDSGNTTGSSSTSWNCNVPSFDPDRNWVRDNDGRVIAYITVSAKDNENNWYYDEYQVGVNDPPPLSVNISGPYSLGYNEQGTFTANPSGGKTPYTNYRWWERKDDDILPLNGGNIILAPPSGYWIEQTSWEGQQTVQVARTYDFSLKCEVTDSDNNTATDIHSVIVGGGLAKTRRTMDETSGIAIPERVELTGNFPNPFNPSTSIRFGLPEDIHVQLTIYSITGQKVISLADGYYSPGYYDIKWNGRNAEGNLVSNGIYVYELRTGHQRIIKKMVFAK